MRKFFLASLFSLYASLGIASAEECKNPVIAGPPIWPPYIVPSKTGEPTGPAIDIAQTILTPLFAAPKLDAGKPWSRVLHDLEKGKIDFVYAILKAPEREDLFVFTENWTHDSYGIVVNQDSSLEYTDIESLSSHQGGYLNGVRLPMPFSKYVENNKNITPINKVDAMYKMLSSGRVDYLIVSYDAFLDLKPQYAPNVTFKLLEKSIVPIPVHMAVSKQSPCAVHIDKINEALKPHVQKLKYRM